MYNQAVGLQSEIIIQMFQHSPRQNNGPICVGGSLKQNTGWRVDVTVMERYEGFCG